MRNELVSTILNRNQVVRRTGAKEGIMSHSG